MTHFVCYIFFRKFREPSLSIYSCRSLIMILSVARYQGVEILNDMKMSSPPSTETCGSLENSMLSCFPSSLLLENAQHCALVVNVCSHNVESLDSNASGHHMCQEPQGRVLFIRLAI
jgi:hypothetical protein